MEVEPVVLNPLGSWCQRARFSEGTVILELASINPTAVCPTCELSSCRIHSRYTRTLDDLPWMGTSVRTKLKVRRFFCDTPACPKRTFAESFPQMAPAHTRKTVRLTKALCWIGLALGGEAGSRLAGRLAMPVSGDTLLRLVRRVPPQTLPVVTVLGVDDWAWHKGLRYGTILCDLERHRPVDLLPERSAEDLSNWLMAHPDVRFIARDRGGCYAQGARAGAPQATQVADRFHLLCNLREALVRTLDRHHQDLQTAAHMVAACQRLPPRPVAEEVPATAPIAVPSTRAQQAMEASRSRRLDRYKRVVELHQQGIPMRQIAQQLGMHRGTVRRFLRAGQFPERAARRYSRRTDPFEDYLRQRWDQGCRNAAQLANELLQRGLRGSYSIVRRRVAPWRDPRSTHTPGSKPVARAPQIPRRPSANQTSWLLLENQEDRTVEEDAFVDALWQQCPKLKIAAEMAQEFVRMVHDRKAGALDGWILRTHGSEVPHELRIFADGLKQDYNAVKAALSLEWSNGQVEGQINRLKMIKRQMYGRAGFDLLRQRVLNTG